MAHANSLVSALALSITGATTLLVACGGSNDGSGPSGAPTAVVPGVGGYAATGGTTAVAPPTTTTAPTSTGTAPPVGTTPPTTGAGGAPAIVPTGTIGAGGVPIAAGGTPAVGGAPSGGTPGAAGSTGAAGSGGAWDPNANLDASGKLIAPASIDVGFQIVTPTFDLEPGQEVFNCFHVATPNTDVYPVGEWDSQMSPGSHHFILYRADSDAQATAQGVLTNPGCTQGFGGSTWLYTMGAPRGHLQMPDAVAMELKPNEHIDFDMHYINTTSDPIMAHIALNVNKVKQTPYQKADAEVSFNVGIAVPPMGTQTVMGTCPNVAGANYFLMQTHMHKHGTDATISKVSASGQITQLVHTTDWDSPQVVTWEQPPFLTLQTGEHFQYTCSYKNDTNQTIYVGTSAATNEMCMMEAYFFPAGATTPACN